MPSVREFKRSRKLLVAQPKHVAAAVDLREEDVPEEQVFQVVVVRVAGLQVAAVPAAGVKSSSTQLLTRKNTNHGSMRNTEGKGTS
jgi:hypothetical protein